MRKIFTLLTAALVALTMSAQVASGTCGNNLRWELTDKGILNIIGAQVPMTEFGEGNAPWKELAPQIKEVMMQSGTTIAAGAFADLPNLIDFSYTGPLLHSVGSHAFANCVALKAMYIASDSVPAVAPDAFEGMTLIGNAQAGNYGSIDAFLYVPYPLIGTFLTEGSYSASGWGQFIIRPKEGALVIKGIDHMWFDEIVYSLSNEGVLEIWPRDETGNGAALTLEYPWQSPFYFEDEIEEVIVHKGVYAIGSGAFVGCVNLKKAVFEEVYSMAESTAPDGAYYFPFMACPQLELLQLQYGLCDYPNDMMTHSLPEHMRLEVPQSKVEYFKEDPFWKRFPIYALPAKASGTLNGLQWMFSYDGVLTVFGEGQIPDFADENATPWAAYNDDVVKLIVGEGVTRIGKYAFSGCYNKTEIFLGTSLTAIADNGLGFCEPYEATITCLAIQVPELEGNYSIYEGAGNIKLLPIYVWNFMEDRFKNAARWPHHQILPLDVTMNDYTVDTLTAQVIDETSLYVTWPALAGAKKYTAILTGEGMTYTFVFDEQGNVLSTEAQKRVSARSYAEKADANPEGFGFLFPGLAPGNYQVSLVAYDESEQPIESSIQSVAVDTSNHATSIENMDSAAGKPSSVTHKLLRNGVLLIERDGKTYNAQGAEVK